MESSNLPPHTSTDSSRVNLTETSAVDLKQQTIARIATILQPVVANGATAAHVTTTLSQPQRPATATRPSDISLLKTVDQQLIQLSQPLRVNGAEKLLLVRLPVEASIQTPQATSVTLKSLVSPEIKDGALLSLLKISPDTIRPQLSQVQFQSLLKLLSQSLNSPITIPVTVIEQDKTSIRLNVGNQKPLIVDIPLTTQNIASPDGVSKKNVDQAKPSFPTMGSLTISFRQNQLQLQISLPTQSALPSQPAVPDAPARAAAHPPLIASLPIDSPVSHKLIQAAAQQTSFLAEPGKLASWAKQLLSATAAKPFQQLTPVSLANVSLQGNEVTITGSKTQLLAVDINQTKGFMQLAPKASVAQISQLNIRTSTGSAPIQVNITPISTQSESTALPVSPQTMAKLTNTASAPSATAQVPQAAPFFANFNSVGTTAERVSLPPNIENIANFKVEQLPLVVKTALETFIRSANRINVSNTDPQNASIVAVTRTLEKFASDNPSLSKPINAILEQLKLSMPIADKPGSGQRSAVNPDTGGSVEAVSPKPANDTAQLSAALKQLMTSPAWLQSPLTISSPPAGQGFVSGLIQLLQVSLLGKHFRSQEDMDQALSRHRGVASNNPAPTSLLGAITGRQLRDFAQLDSQQNLLKQLKGLLAGHQSAKLGNMEQTLQGQDSFYYVLPGLLPQQKPAELLVRREHEHQSDAEQETESTSWHLTMKLDVGEQGELLTKAKISNEQLYLDIYTSNQPLLEKVGLTLPFLLKRFAQLGLTVEEHKLQLGKIPETLAARPYQILETQA